MRKKRTPVQVAAVEPAAQGMFAVSVGPLPQREPVSNQPPSDVATTISWFTGAPDVANVPKMTGILVPPQAGNPTVDSITNRYRTAGAFGMGGVPHTPFVQACPPVQTVPQPPQFAVSVAVLTQIPLHRVWPTGQAEEVHTPFAQLCPLAQVMPQPPQLAVSVAVLTQVVPQRVWPTGQAGKVQAPPTHVRPAAQTLLQDPQLALSVAVLTQVPLQTVWPLAQLTIG